MSNEIAATVADAYDSRVAGRKKDPEKKRVDKIVVMMTVAEKQLLVDAVEQKTDLELSQWVRQVLFAEARRLLGRADP